MRYTVLATAFSLSLISFALLATAPDISYAQAGGLVPCNGPECNICHLTQLAQNFIEFVVRITFIAAALLFAYAGFLFFTGGTSPDRITNARKIFTNTFVGIVIVLTSWLVVDVILKTLVGQGVNPFTSILCDIRTTSTVSDTQSSDANTLRAGGTEQTKTEQAKKEGFLFEVQNPDGSFESRVFSTLSACQTAQSEITSDDGEVVFTCSGQDLGGTAKTSLPDPSYTFEIQKSDGTYENRIFSSYNQCKTAEVGITSVEGQVVFTCEGLDLER